PRDPLGARPGRWLDRGHAPQPEPRARLVPADALAHGGRALAQAGARRRRFRAAGVRSRVSEGDERCDRLAADRAGAPGLPAVAALPDLAVGQAGEHAAVSG